MKFSPLVGISIRFSDSPRGSGRREIGVSVSLPGSGRDAAGEGRRFIENRVRCI